MVLSATEPILSSESKGLPFQLHSSLLNVDHKICAMYNKPQHVLLKAGFGISWLPNAWYFNYNNIISELKVQHFR